MGLARNKRYYVDIKDFGAVGNGTDATAAFEKAHQYCESTGAELIITRGDYIVSRELKPPTRYSIKGIGYGSNIILNLYDGQYGFKEGTSFVYSSSIENIRFTTKNKKVGALYIENAQRGITLRNIWTFDIAKPFYFGEKIWGVLSLENVFSYMLNESFLDDTAITIRSNTVMMSNVEVIGAWGVGLQADNATVFKLDGFNIAGSPSRPMKRAIRMNNVSSGYIKAGWIEQLDTTYWLNGEGEAIYLTNPNAVSVENVNVATGSIFIDGGKATVKNISYAEENGGLRVLHNALVSSDLTGVKRQNHKSKMEWCDGEIQLQGINTNSLGTVLNPTLRYGLPHVFTKSNDSFVTIEDELLDYASSDRSLRVTVTKDYQGVEMLGYKLHPGQLYTAVVKVKNVQDLKSVYITPGDNVLTSTTYPACMTRSDVTGWHTLYYPFTVTDVTPKVRILALLKDGKTSGEFLVDSVDIMPGFNPFDPSWYTNYQLSESGRLRANSYPKSGNWNVGDKCLNNNPKVGDFLSWVCIQMGSPGVWKGINQL
ncbi:glycoside hydrolase family 55 protein [Bacillus cereus]|nr:glycoside hydrolase family 55 protein [Bacillus cereus]